MALAAVKTAAGLLIAAAASASSRAEEPKPTSLVPEAVSTDAPSLFFSIGLGPGPGENARVDARSPAFAFAVGGAFPIRGRVYVDVATGFIITDYQDHAAAYSSSDSIFLTTWTVTASIRGGHAGEKAGVYGSAGMGFAYVKLGALGGYGWYSEPLDSTAAPALTAAFSLEAPTRSRSRFIAELRYWWIDAHLSDGAGGSLEAGGPILNCGWRYVF